MFLYPPRKSPGESKRFFWISSDFITFCPTTPEMLTEMQDAIQWINALIPFVPRSILFESRAPSCLIEISSLSTTQQRARVHLKHLPTAYHVTKSLIRELAQRTDVLASVEMPIRFAITGENFSFGTNLLEYNELQISLPNCHLATATVFARKPSHLVVLSDSALGPEFASRIESWSAHISVGPSRRKEVELVNRIARGRVVCRYENDTYVVQVPESTYTGATGSIDPAVAERLQTAELNEPLPTGRTEIRHSFAEIVRAFEQEMFGARLFENVNVPETIATRRLEPKAGTNFADEEKMSNVK
jgi:hypothetical protein